MARQVARPMDVTEHPEPATRIVLNFNLQYPPYLVGATRFVLNFNLQYPPYLVELERQKNLLQALFACGAI